jgi:hypothetical protein
MLERLQRYRMDVARASKHDHREPVDDTRLAVDDAAHDFFSSTSSA